MVCSATVMKGYLHSGYAASLSEFGTPISLPESDGWLLQRPIWKTGLVDAMGPYPLFCCQNWARLPLDLMGLAGRIVSVSIVTDPFGNYTGDLLERCFDRVLRFKEHFVSDLSSDSVIGSSHHRYYARWALRRLAVDRVDAPARYLEEWIKLYQILIEQKNLVGIHRFSVDCFRKQFEIPGLVMFKAEYNGKIVGAQLWFLQDKVAYSHLQATSHEGYKLRAPYALYSTAISSFRNEVRWLALGSGAGIYNQNYGLTKFKREWATGTKPVFLCGRICDPARYSELVASVSTAGQTNFFPEYRALRR